MDDILWPSHARRTIVSTSAPFQDSLASSSDATPRIFMASSTTTSSTTTSSHTPPSASPAAPLWERLGFADPHQLKRDIFLASLYNQGLRQRQQQPPSYRQAPPQPSSSPTSSVASSHVDADVMVDNNDVDEEDGDEGDATLHSEEDDLVVAAPPTTTTTLSSSREKEESSVSSTSTSPTSTQPPSFSNNYNKWNIQFCRTTISSFQQYVQYFAEQSQRQEEINNASPPLLDDHHNNNNEHQDLQLIHDALFSSETTSRAFKALLRCQYPTFQLADMVRDMERWIGQITIPTKIAFTDEISLRLLEANGKAGNVGRAMALLQLRTHYQFRPRRNEFMFCITSIQAAGLQYRTNTNNTNNNNDSSATLADSKKAHYYYDKNIYRTRAQQKQQQQQQQQTWQQDAMMMVEDPTRWLDAILLNMSQRQFPLDIEVANHMLLCFSSTGKSAKALHFFYHVIETKEPVVMRMNHKRTTTPTTASPSLAKLASTIMMTTTTTTTTSHPPASSPLKSAQPSSIPRGRRIRIKMSAPPPFYKVPSLAKNAKVHYWIPQAPRSSSRFILKQKTNTATTSTAPTAAGAAASSITTNKMVKRLRSELEVEPDFAVSLTAAFRFCDSLTMGCAGHEPVELDVTSYNLLIKACVNEGALFRALSLLQDTMPRQGVTPNAVSYNTVLVGLARVGDVTTMMDLWVLMQGSSHIEITSHTVKYMVEGMLNRGDVSGATSFVQAAFNQHVVLPPYPVHLQILEMALGLDLEYEARRHVQFIQQMWKWQRNAYHTSRQAQLVRLQQRQRKLSKAALQQLFQYFGYKLPESEFY